MRPPIDAAAPAAGLQKVSAAIRRILDTALSGAQVNAAAALQLLTCDAPDDVSAILAVASHMRTELKGTTVTYSPKVFVPITNVCRDRCTYCTFRSDPSDAHAWTMLPEEIRACVAGGRRLGCAEALMCLGDRPETAFRDYRATLAVLGHDTTVSYVHQACAIALEEGLLPHTNAGILTREELRELKPVNVSFGLMLENVSPRLRQRGEVHHAAPDKDPAVRLRMLRDAGALQIPFTTGLLLGIGETLAERIETLQAIEATQREYGHIQEVIVQNFRAKPTTRMAAHPEPDSIDTAKTIAVARLMLRDMNIQAPPNLSPYDHRLFLSAGINDWGGISPLTPDYVNPEAPWPHVTALAETCRSEGFTLQPRLPIYTEYLERPGFLDPALHAAVAQHAPHKGAAPC